MPLEGLIAAPHTPMRSDGDLHLDVVALQALSLARSGVAGAFIGGTTGEAHSLTVAERKSLAESWATAGRANQVAVTVHVGHNCQRDAQTLATHAAELGVYAIAALAPSYFKPGSVEDLIDFLAPIAAAAPHLPFYYYDIPGLTGVNLPVPDLLVRGRPRMPNLAGVKYSHGDLIQLQECLRLDSPTFEVLFGCDECLLAALALGVRGAVGSTYNFAPGLYLRMMQAFAAGDLPTARGEQLKSVRLVRILSQYGYAAASKALMGLIGIECGPVRPPLRPLAREEISSLRADLEQAGLFAELVGVTGA